MEKTVKVAVAQDAITPVEEVAQEVVPETVIRIVSQDAVLPVSAAVRPIVLQAVKVHAQAVVQIQTESVQ